MEPDNPALHESCVPLTCRQRQAYAFRGGKEYTAQQAICLSMADACFDRNEFLGNFSVQVAYQLGFALKNDPRGTMGAQAARTWVTYFPTQLRLEQRTLLKFSTRSQDHVHSCSFMFIHVHSCSILLDCLYCSIEGIVAGILARRFLLPVAECEHGPYCNLCTFRDCIFGGNFGCWSALLPRLNSKLKEDERRVCFGSVSSLLPALQEMDSQTTENHLFL